MHFKASVMVPIFPLVNVDPHVRENQMRRKTMIGRMLKKLAPLTAAVVLLTSAGAHAQLGTMNSGSSLNPGMPSASLPGLSGELSPGEMPPALPGMRTPGLNNPRISNYGAGGMQRLPGSPPRFH
jgi:hypothetical protein